MLQDLTPEELDTFGAQSEEDLIDQHFGLDARIRDEPGLWERARPGLRTGRSK